MNEREKLEQKALDEDDLITINLLFPHVDQSPEKDCCW